MRRHRFGHAVPWFNGNHPRARDAQSLCRRLGHDPSLRLGPACGACWEATIRTSSGGRALLREERGAFVERAQDLAELNAIAGGVGETVMTATPARIRRLLERAFTRLVANVDAQHAADTAERRTFTEAVADLTDVFNPPDDEPLTRYATAEEATV